MNRKYEASTTTENPIPIELRLSLSTSECSEKLSTLSSLNRDGLVAEWKSVFEIPAPRSAQVNLLRGAIAWKYQADADVSNIATQLTRQIRGWTAHAPVAMLPKGTNLIREWKGKTHRIIVLEEGFEYEGQIYRSLTAITRKITGMGWSGPHFFGLRK